MDDFSKPRENCGLCVGRTLHDTYNFISDLQHRGRDAAGIAAVGQDRIDVLKWAGEVKSFDKDDLHCIFDGNYHTFIAHVRYRTKGNNDSESLLRSAHPITIGGEEERRNDHVIIRDCNAVIAHNGQVSDMYFRGIAEDELKANIDTEKLLRLYLQNGIRGLVRSVPGAYTLVIADKRCMDVMAARDKTGIKPGFLGFKDTKYILASEDIAFQKNGGIAVEEMTPGTVYFFSPDGAYSTERVEEPVSRKCFFEWNYIANASSNLNGVSVLALRKKLGERLAEEFPVDDADFVSFVPRCPEPAARSYATARRIPFIKIFYKRKAQRAFQGPAAKEREDSIKANLYLIPRIDKKIRGRKIIVIDDSTIRGNNSLYARHLLYDVAGVAEAHLLNYTPEIGIIGDDGIPRGCEFGVDMPPEENEEHKFIARNRNVDEISKIIGMPVRFISRQGMLDVFRSFGIAEESLCSFCIGGKHPFEGLEKRVFGV